MKIKTLLLAAFIVTAIAIVALQKGQQPESRDARLGKTLITASAIDTLGGIKVETAVGKVDLALQDGKWVVPGRAGFPADLEKLEKLFQKLNQTTAVEMVTSNEKRHSSLGLEWVDGQPVNGDATVLSLIGKDGEKVSTLIMGKSRQSKEQTGGFGAGADGQYLRFAGSNECYLISERVWVDKKTPNWIRHNMAAYPPDDLKSITVDFPEPEKTDVKIFRNLTSEALTIADIPAGKQLKKAQIDSATSFFSTLAVDDVVAVGTTLEKTAFENPVKVAMETFDGIRLDIRIGSSDVTVPDTGSVRLVSITATAPEGLTGEKADKVSELAASGARWVYALRAWRVQNLTAELDKYFEDQPKPAEPAQPVEAEAAPAEKAPVAGATAEAAPADVAAPAPTDETAAPASVQAPEVPEAPEAPLTRVSASHILVAWKGADRASAGRSREEADKLIKEIKASLAKGESFEALAKKHSDCPSGSKGGDLGFFGRGRMAKPFEDAAFALKIGQISDIVETKFGFHLIRRDK